ncbi:MAG TPA: hypothetical protein VIL71_05315 [Spirillospora sp.]
MPSPEKEAAMADKPEGTGERTGTQTTTQTSQTASRTANESGPSAPRTRRSLIAGLAAARRRLAAVVATVVSVITTVVVVVLAVHIVFVAFEANTGNDLVRWFGERATDLSWQFKDVFQPENPKISVAVNYGMAALVYLIAGRILVGMIKRAGRT